MALAKCIRIRRIGNPYEWSLTIDGQDFSRGVVNVETDSPADELPTVVITLRARRVEHIDAFGEE